VDGGQHGAGEVGGAGSTAWRGGGTQVQGQVEKCGMTLTGSYPRVSGACLLTAGETVAKLYL